MTLTSRQMVAAQRILAAYAAFQQRHGYPPSQRELAKAAHLSLTGLGYYLPLMDAAGMITVEPGARGIRVVREGEV